MYLSFGIHVYATSALDVSPGPFLCHSSTFGFEGDAVVGTVTATRYIVAVIKSSAAVDVQVRTNLCTMYPCCRGGSVACTFCLFSYLAHICASKLWLSQPIPIIPWSVPLLTIASLTAGAASHGTFCGAHPIIVRFVYCCLLSFCARRTFPIVSSQP